MLARVKDWLEKNPVLGVVIGGALLFVLYLLARAVGLFRPRERPAMAPLQVIPGQRFQPPAPPVLRPEPTPRRPDPPAAVIPPVETPPRQLPPEVRMIVQPPGEIPDWRADWAEAQAALRREMEAMRDRLLGEGRVAAAAAVNERMQERVYQPAQQVAQPAQQVAQPAQQVAQPVRQAVEWREIYPGVVEQVIAPITDVLRQIVHPTPTFEQVRMTPPVAREFRPPIDPMHWEIEIDPGPVWTPPVPRGLPPGMETAPIDTIPWIPPVDEQVRAYQPVAREFRPPIDPMHWEIEIDPGPVW